MVVVVMTVEIKFNIFKLNLISCTTRDLHNLVIAIGYCTTISEVYPDYSTQDYL